MNLENRIRPYYVCGGFPKAESWIFFTPCGEIEIGGCNKALEVLLPMCNGMNHIDFVRGKLEEMFSKEEVEELLFALFQQFVLVDSNRIFQVFYAYSKNPMHFFEALSAEETSNFVGDQSHLPVIGGSCFEAKFQKNKLQEIMDKRCSTREFSGETMDKETIFSLVWNAYGEQVKRMNGESDFLERTFTVPSGGALYPLFIYVVLFRQCGSLMEGIYLWHKEKNLLELVKAGNFLSEAEKIVSGIPSLKSTVGLMCVVADFERSAKKYSNKAYNLIQQEAGHVMQNVALFCADNNIGVVEIGGYDDEPLAGFLNLSFPNQAPLIIAAFGKKGGNDDIRQSRY